MGEKPELSIVIINHNARELTAQAVNSVFSESPASGFEIIVVENGDLPDERFSDPRGNLLVLRGVENRGFGHACNIGARSARGSLLLFLNNDALVHHGTLDGCIRYFHEHSAVGALGARTVQPDGSLDPGCKRGFPSPSSALYYFLGMDKRHPKSTTYGHYHQTFIPDDAVCEVDSVSGAFLMIPRETFERVGGFDEQFFMYGEDLDLCWRVKEIGLKVIYLGNVSLTHLRGQSGLCTDSETVLRCFYQSMEIFYHKHYDQSYPRALSLCVLLGIRAQYALALLKRRVRRARPGRESRDHPDKQDKREAGPGCL